MRLASNRNLLSLLGFLALSSILTGCPEKDGASTTAEPERPEVDDEGKADETKRPAAAAPAVPAEVKKVEKVEKVEDEKDKGGW